MFDLYESIKKRLFGNASDNIGKGIQKSNNEFDWDASVGKVINQRRERERKAYADIVKKHDVDSMSESEVYGLIHKGAMKILPKEQEEDLKMKSFLRTIKTLRTIEEITDAVDSGQNILEQEVKPSNEIYVTDVYIKDMDTGEIYTRPYSYSAIIESDGENRKMIKKETYYPYTFPSKIAAYVIPEDLIVGEKVLIEDLIEDIVGASHSEGRYRLASAEAMWNGEKFIVDRGSYDVEITMG